jgi:hypothetical protein
MFEEHYIQWRDSRINCIDKYIAGRGNSFFKNKTLLEVGCGYADIGNIFNKKYNCIVTSVDARKEHIDVVLNKYPNLSTYVFDADNEELQGNYNIILHWGLLYHLYDIEKHLKNICSRCDFLFLETEVCDSLDDNFRIYIREEGYDQAFNNIGIKPSEKYVEKILKNNNFNFRIILDPILNTPNHCYSWVNSNNNSFNFGQRRFWFCWKNGTNIDFIN